MQTYASCSLGLYGGFPKLGGTFLGPSNKDYDILEFILGSPYLLLAMLQILCAGQLTASFQSAASLGVPVSFFPPFLGRVLGS